MEVGEKSGVILLDVKVCFLCIK